VRRLIDHPGAVTATQLTPFTSAGKNLFDLNTRIRPTRKKSGTDKNFSSEFKMRTLNFFTFLLSELDFDSNLPSSELSDPKKTGYRTSISRPNFDIVRIVQPEFDPNPNFCQRYLLVSNLGTGVTTSGEKT